MEMDDTIYVIKMTVGVLAVGCLLAIFGFKLGDWVRAGSPETNAVPVLDSEMRQKEWKQLQMKLERLQEETTVSNDELDETRMELDRLSTKAEKSQERTAGTNGQFNTPKNTPNPRENLMLVLLFGALISIPLIGLCMFVSCWDALTP